LKHPHDRLFRRVFSRPDLATGLFRAALSAEQARAIDWESLAPVPAELLDDRLLARHADLVFVARLKGSSGRVVYLLLEHKSWRDRGTARQTRRYRSRGAPR
jgi:hypothetical protein